MARLRAITDQNRKWWTLGAMSFSLFMIMLDNTVVNVALPSIQKDLGASLSALEWTINAYTLAIAVLLVSAGRLGDIFGRRRAFLFGVSVFALSSATAGFAPNDISLIVSRAVQGIGAAFMMPATLSIVTNAFPPAERGRAIGTWAGVSALALAIGPVVGGFLTEQVSWRAIFFLNLPVAVLALVVTIAAVRESRDRTVPRTIDYAGVATITVGIGALVLALIEGNDWGWGSARIIGLFALSVAGLLAFALVERRVRFPMVEFGFVRSRQFIGTNGIAFVVSFAMLAMFFFMALYMQNILGYSPLEAGIRFLPSTVVIIVAAPIAGRLTDRIGARIPIVVGLTLVAIALYWQSTITVDTGYGTLLPTFSLMGLGIGLTMSPMSTAAMNAVQETKAGVASGILSMSRMVGGTFGVAAVGALFQHLSDNRLHERLGELPLSAQQQAWFANNLGSGAVDDKLKQLDPNTAQQVGGVLKETFVHSLSVSLKLSTAVAVAGVAIALVMLRDKRAREPAPVRAVPAPEATVAAR
jgi:EmrB/QacA subfamily drug resistance transporter